MNSYTVENTSFATADGLDLGRLFWANDDAPVTDTAATIGGFDGVNVVSSFGTGLTSTEGMGCSNGMEEGSRGQDVS